ncbi:MULTISPECIES: hypothetical protein [unclassified Limnothrix]|nr:MULTISPECIES: hypothetical protein [unclassified Limnothrix]MBD2192766.1 hypothetical protein [Limnothrix sp. FACHB-1088]
MIPISPPISPLRSPEMALRWSIVLRDRGVRAPVFSTCSLNLPRSPHGPL